MTGWRARKHPTRPAGDREQSPVDVPSKAPRLCVIHVPKSGGLALRDALLACVRAEDIAPWHFTAGFFAWYGHWGTVSEEGRRRIAVTRYERRRLRTYPVSFGHFLFDDVHKTKAPVVTVLREPRARLVSLHSYWRSVDASTHDQMGPYGDATRTAGRLPFGDFLDYEPTLHQVDNAMARQFLPAAMCPPRQPLDPHRRCEYENALERVLKRVTLIGLQTDLARFTGQLSYVTAWQIPTPARVNETQLDARRPHLSINEVARADRQLAARTWLDQWLVSTALQRPELVGVRYSPDDVFESQLQRVGARGTSSPASSFPSPSRPSGRERRESGGAASVLP
jgi:hypothetical protein